MAFTITTIVDMRGIKIVRYQLKKLSEATEAFEKRFIMVWFKAGENVSHIYTLSI